MTTKLYPLEQVQLAQLYLDPNNPRFGKCESVPITKDSIALQPEFQEKLRERYWAKEVAGDSDTPEEDSMNIEELRNSMLRIGYVGIDKMVVRRIDPAEDKYLVLEGNRRVATLKSLVHQFTDKPGKPPAGTSGDDEPNFAKHRESFLKLDVLELQSEGLSAGELHHQISVILGIRHHSSVLEWEPVARAFNIYSEYLKRTGGDFEKVEPKEVKAVAELLCISKPEVSKALRSYIGYLQVREAGASVRNEDFSLIETAVTNPALRNGCLNIDANSYRLDGASVERITKILQLGRRHELPVNGGAKKIIANPGELRTFGKIFGFKSDMHNDGEREFVESVINSVENENNPLTVDEGFDRIVAYIHSKNWIIEVNNSLTLKDEKLKEEAYQGIANERGYREAVTGIVAKLSRVLGI